MKNRNDLGELNDILFARLRALDDPDLKGEDLDAEIRKTDAVIDVSQSIIATGNLVLKAALALCIEEARARGLSYGQYMAWKLTKGESEV